MNALQSDTFFGISFQVWLFVILGAVTWAATWVLNLKPAKDLLKMCLQAANLEMSAATDIDV